ncbi:MAG: hypothetical protein ACYS99_21915 [Planctomycetota bacterium]|jgi:hypothetical protein
MRAAIVAGLLAAALSLPWPTRAGWAEESPFAGWDETRIAKHKSRAKADIAGKLSRWLSARKKLVFKCQRCHGSGKERVHSARRTRIITCRSCAGTKLCVKAEYYRRVFWDYYSPRYKNEPGRQAYLEEDFKKARKKPLGLDVISGWKKGKIEVHGNHASVTFTEKRGKTHVERTMEWVEAGGKWWIAHEKFDKDTKRWKYPEPDAAPAADPADPTAKAEPGKPAPPGAKPEPAPEPAPKPPPKPKKPPEDPAKLFEIYDITVKHVEGDAHKVMGRVKNKTADRRFAYLNVEVSLFKGDDLVESASCNVGTTILKAGESATFSGYIYADPLPDYDRIEAKVSQFEGFE